MILAWLWGCQTVDALCMPFVPERGLSGASPKLAADDCSSR